MKLADARDRFEAPMEFAKFEKWNTARNVDPRQRMQYADRTDAATQDTEGKEHLDMNFPRFSTRDMGGNDLRNELGISFDIGDEIKYLLQRKADATAHHIARHD